jgi:uncharacterized protein YciI
MHWIVTYEVVDDYVERREAIRERHLEVVRAAHDSGLLVMGGAFSEPVDGAVIIFESDDAKPIEDWIGNDPYVRAGLVTSWQVRKWSVGNGYPNFVLG